MKLPVLKSIDKGGLGANLPAFLDPLLSAINSFIEPVGRALQNNLTLEDNFLCKKVSQSFTSGTAQSLSSGNTKLRVTGIFPVYAGEKTLTGWKLVRNSDGSATVTLTFSEGGAATCLLYLFLG